MSAFKVQKTVTVAVGGGSNKLSEAFAIGDFLRGSFICTAVTTGNINFDVSNDGTNWDTLSNADASFADITAPAVNLPRSLPAALFKFKFARIHASANQATADATIVLTLFGA